MFINDARGLIRKTLLMCVWLLPLILGGCATRSIPREVSVMAAHEGRGVPLKRREKIVIDAGHGGRDSGAASRKEDYEEKSLALSTAFLVQEQLKRMGYQTLLTRNHDTYIPLDARAEMANTSHADLFVSVHYNFSTSNEASGIEVFYYKEEKNPTHPRIVASKKLAQIVLGSVIDRTGSVSRGVKQANFAVVRETLMPAVLIEAGFLSNRRERERLRDPIYLNALAKGIAEGVDAYLTRDHSMLSPKKLTSQKYIVN